MSYGFSQDLVRVELNLMRIAMDLMQISVRLVEKSCGSVRI